MKKLLELEQIGRSLLKVWIYSSKQHSRNTSKKLMNPSKMLEKIFTLEKSWKDWKQHSVKNSTMNQV